MTETVHPSRTSILCCLAALTIISLLATAVAHHEVGPPWNFVSDILAHIFAVLLELFLAIWVIEKLWKGLEIKHKEKERREQLRCIKNYMFHAHMYDLFEVNFGSLRDANGISFEKISSCKTPKDFVDLIDKLKITQEEHTHYRSDLYKNASAKAEVFFEYIKAEKTVWERFVELAVLFNFSDVVAEITRIQRCIAKVRKETELLRQNTPVIELRSHPLSEETEEANKSAPRREAIENEYKEAIGIPSESTHRGRITNPSKEEIKILLEHKQELATEINRIIAAGIEKFIDFSKDLYGNSGSSEFDTLVKLYTKEPNAGFCREDMQKREPAIPRA